MTTGASLTDFLFAHSFLCSLCIPNRPGVECQRIQPRKASALCRHLSTDRQSTKRPSTRVPRHLSKGPLAAEARAAKRVLV